MSKEDGENLNSTADSEERSLDVKDDDVVIEHTSKVTPEGVVKHPLQNTWTLWYLEVDRNKNWQDMQNEITSFDTVEDFWR